MKPATQRPGEGATAFAEIARRCRHLPGVEEGRMFGATALKCGGKVFAMLVKGDLVVKVPAERAAALIAHGTALPFDPGHGKVMKEWVAVAAAQSALWGDLAEEARAFVGGARTAKRGRTRK